MVEPIFLVLGAVVFVILLVFILRSASQQDGTPKDKKKSKQQVQQQKLKQKRGRTSLRKNERPAEVQEWVGIDTPAKDSQEMLEFLKGKDPVHLAKHQAAAAKQGKKKEKKPLEEVQSSEESASEDIPTEGWEDVVKKKPVEKKKKTNKKKATPVEEAKPAAPKPFHRVLGPDGQPIKDEKKENRKKGEGERKPQEPRADRPEGEKRERKERQPREGGEKQGEKRERENREAGSDADKPPKKEVRRPITSPPNVKQEDIPDLNDMLNSITQGFKPKPQIRRVSSAFSKLDRVHVTQILSKLEARDLVALSAVNHYFMGVARRDVLWKDLLLRDFGLRDFGKARNARAAYKAEYKKKHSRKGKKDEASLPLGEDKDIKADVPKGGKERKEKKVESSTEDTQE